MARVLAMSSIFTDLTPLCKNSVMAAFRILLRNSNL